jgi:hypothetical protein
MARAAARFWGTLTLGAHADGFLANGHGRPTHLWIARRALDKATDPGSRDNVVADHDRGRLTGDAGLRPATRACSKRPRASPHSWLRTDPRLFEPAHRRRQLP